MNNCNSNREHKRDGFYFIQSPDSPHEEGEGILIEAQHYKEGNTYNDYLRAGFIRIKDSKGYQERIIGQMDSGKS
jgi:hypothetical protein